MVLCKYATMSADGTSRSPGADAKGASPQYGSQGTAQTLQELNAATGVPAVAVGAYANVEARTYIPEDPATHFDGADFLPVLQQAIDGQAIFVASILVRDCIRCLYVRD